MIAGKHLWSKGCLNDQKVIPDLYLITYLELHWHFKAMSCFRIRTWILFSEMKNYNSIYFYFFLLLILILKRKSVRGDFWIVLFVHLFKQACCKIFFKWGHKVIECIVTSEHETDRLHYFHSFCMPHVHNRLVSIY